MHAADSTIQFHEMSIARNLIYDVHCKVFPQSPIIVVITLQCTFWLHNLRRNIIKSWAIFNLYSARSLLREIMTEKVMRKVCSVWAQRSCLSCYYHCREKYKLASLQFLFSVALVELSCVIKNGKILLKFRRIQRIFKIGIKHDDTGYVCVEKYRGFSQFGKQKKNFFEFFCFSFFSCCQKTVGERRALWVSAHCKQTTLKLFLNLSGR